MKRLVAAAAILLTLFLLAGTAYAGDRKQYTVVVDAGHGGYETGAVSRGVKEKDLNLDTARRLVDLLKKNGIKTYMTRNSDTDVGLYERSGLANKLKADLFVSIHNNAEGNSSRSGTMTLYYPASGPTKGNLSGKRLATLVQRELVAKLGTNNLGIIPRPNLVVLRETDMPAVIAELGYMTNKAELGRLKTAQFKQNAVEALKNAILKALKEI